jgi:hypothetical protein
MVAKRRTQALDFSQCYLFPGGRRIRNHRLCQLVAANIKDHRWPDGMFVMNNWKKQRELLIEEALAFTQKIAANASKRDVPSAQQSVKVTESPVCMQEPVATKDLAPKDERAAIQRRLMNFKTHQERFQREREEYYAMTMAKARASQWNAPKT